MLSFLLFACRLCRMAVCLCRAVCIGLFRPLFQRLTFGLWPSSFWFSFSRHGRLAQGAIFAAASVARAAIFDTSLPRGRMPSECARAWIARPPVRACISPRSGR